MPSKELQYLLKCLDNLSPKDMAYVSTLEESCSLLRAELEDSEERLSKYRTDQIKVIRDMQVDQAFEDGCG